MATPQQTMDRTNLANRNTSLSFPSDINNAECYCKLTFSSYNRARPSSTSTNKVTSTVVLPIPDTLGDVHSANWNQAELGIVGGAFDLGGQVIDKIQSGNGLYETIKEGMSGIDITNGRTAALLAMILAPPSMRDGKLQTAAMQTLGAVVNPHLSLMYSGQALRPHSLSWTLSPRTEKEAGELGTIISTIRKSILPAFEPNLSKFALQFPDTVEVEFFGVDTNYKSKIFKSAVVNMATDFVAAKGPSFYAKGRPVITTLALQLVETEIVTRSDFESNSQ